MNDRQINDVRSEFPHGADELDLAPEALKDLTVGTAQEYDIRCGPTLPSEAYRGCWEAETM